MKALDKAVALWNESLATIRSLEQMIEAVALLVVSYYNIVTLNSHASPFEFKVRVAAGTLIGLRGAWEFLKYVRRHKEV